MSQHEEAHADPADAADKQEAVDDERDSFNRMSGSRSRSRTPSTSSSDYEQGDLRSPRSSDGQNKAKVKALGTFYPVSSLHPKKAVRFDWTNKATLIYYLTNLTNLSPLLCVEKVPRK